MHAYNSEKVHIKTLVLWQCNTHTFQLSCPFTTPISLSLGADKNRLANTSCSFHHFNTLCLHDITSKRTCTMI